MAYGSMSRPQHEDPPFHPQAAFARVNLDWETYVAHNEC
jgi:hypothetical protein